MLLCEAVVIGYSRSGRSSGPLDCSTLRHMEALEYTVNDPWIGDRNILDLAIGLSKSMRTIWKPRTPGIL